MIECEDIRLSCTPAVVLTQQIRYPILRKLRYVLLHEDLLNVAEWRHGLELFKPYFSGLYNNQTDILYFSGRVGERFLHVPVMAGHRSPQLITQLHAVLGHAGRDKVLQVARGLRFHPTLSAVVA